MIQTLNPDFILPVIPTHEDLFVFRPTTYSDSISPNNSTSVDGGGGETNTELIENKTNIDSNNPYKYTNEDEHVI